MTTAKNELPTVTTGMGFADSIKSTEAKKAAAPPAAAETKLEPVKEVPKKKSKKPDMVFSSATVSIGCIGEGGKMQEILLDVSGDDVRITQCVVSQNKKFRQTKTEEGDIIGFEPTGEHELTLRVKYIKE